MGQKVNRREEVKIEVRKPSGKEVMKRQRTSLIAGLSQKEQRELLQDLNYLNTGEIKAFCKKHGNSLPDCGCDYGRRMEKDKGSRVVRV